MWNTALPDWQERIKAHKSLIPPLPLIQSEARRARAIFEKLRLPDVPGQPLMSEAAGDWQKELVEAIFGSYDPETQERHIREFFVLVPKKNSKTTFGAAAMTVALLVNRRPNAEFLIVAPTQEVSDLAFRQAVGMIEADPVLAAKFQVQSHLKKLTFRPTGAFLKVKSFDPGVVTGAKPSAVLLDEMHVMARSPDADRVIGQLRGGLLPNPEAFLLTITTQGERPPAGVFRAELMKARKVRDGHLKAPTLPVLYEFPPDVDWRDPANWSMVTPNRGRSITVERLIPDYDGAVAAGEEELRRWASQHLDVEVGLALAHDRWAGADFWESSAEPGLTLDTLLARCDVATVGIDGGGLDDLLGLAVIGRDKITRQWLHWGHAWAHPSVLERRKAQAPRLKDFERDGDLTIVERMGDDIEQVAEVVQKVKAAGLLPAQSGVGVDPAGIGAIVDALAERGIGDGAVVGVSQGWKLGGAIKTFERKLADGTLKHCGQGLLAWSAGNCKVEPRGNSILITKQAAGTAKIDPMIAAFCAGALMAMNPAGVGTSIWDRSDLSL